MATSSRAFSVFVRSMAAKARAMPILSRSPNAPKRRNDKTVCAGAGSPHPLITDSLPVSVQKLQPVEILYLLLYAQRA